MRLKGLVFRELYLGRKNYLLLTAVWLFMVALGVLIQLSILYGNMSQMPPEELAETAPTMLNIFTYMPAALIMIMSLSNIEVIFSDYSVKWSNFSYTTPVSEKKYVGVKYFIKASMLVTAFVLSVINAAVLCSFADKTLDGRVVTIMLWIMVGVSIISVIQGQLAYKYKEKGKVEKMMILYAAILYVLIVGAFLCIFIGFKNANTELAGNAFMDAFADKLQVDFDWLTDAFFAAMPFLPFVIIAVLALGYFLEVKAMKRRDN